MYCGFSQFLGLCFLLKFLGGGGGLYGLMGLYEIGTWFSQESTRASVGMIAHWAVNPFQKGHSEGFSAMCFVEFGSLGRGIL